MHSCATFSLHVVGGCGLRPALSGSRAHPLADLPAADRVLRSLRRVNPAEPNGEAAPVGRAIDDQHRHLEQLPMSTSRSILPAADSTVCLGPPAVIQGSADMARLALGLQTTAIA